MSSPRLRTQFETLFEYYSGLDSDVQLDDVTNILCCTRRNARIVLNKMEEAGWIDWKPAAGRGKLSRLSFLRSRVDVSEGMAKRYLAEGKIGQALDVLDKDASHLSQVIQSYLGVQVQGGQQVVRLPYYRPLTNLDPASPLRRSEQHIIRHIFSGLTTLSDNGELQPDLAHAWQMIARNCWRFFLRPSVRFHNGDNLTVGDVIENLNRLRKMALFEHIESVTSPADWVVDITTSIDDVRLPLLLAEGSAKITLPILRRDEDYALHPIGTGPYRVVENTHSRLVLQAYDSYFSFRPLLDKIEVCVIEEAHSTLVFPNLEGPLRTQRKNSNEDVAIDPGSIYLMLNRRSGIAANETWAEYLSHKLSSLDVFRALPRQTVVDLGLLPAYGLKPGWNHALTTSSIEVPPQVKPVTIAYHAKHPLFPDIVKAITRLLSEDSVEVELVPYDHTIEDKAGVDIWLRAMGLSTRREDALAGWLLNYSEAKTMALDSWYQEWLNLINEWRKRDEQVFPGIELSRSMTQYKFIVPLFHNWMGVSQDHCGTLQNAKCNAVGWFDFSTVWVRPDFK